MTEFQDFRTARAGNTRLRAPYSFVPIDEIVLPSPIGTPDLSRPVEKAVSGTLTIRWAHETPLLVGGSEEAANQPFALGGKYTLPGASLRGLIRSVVEIAAFGRANFVDDFAGRIRHIKSPTWKAGTSPSLQHAPQGGWLFFAGGGFHLVAADLTLQLPVTDIARELGISAAHWHASNLHDRIELLQRHARYGLVPPGKWGLAAGHDPVQLAPSNTTPDGSKKTTERVFVWPNEDYRRTQRLNDRHVRRFLDALYRDPNAKRGEPPTANLDAILRTGGVQFMTRDAATVSLDDQMQEPARYALPVFWRVPGKPNATQPAAEPQLSLTAFMSKTYDVSVHDLLAKAQRADGNPDDDTLDLAEALFGWAPPDGEQKTLTNRKARQRAWRGRVKFGFATSSVAVDPNGRETEKPDFALSRPHPSSYTFYLRPLPGAEHPLDYDNPRVTLAGRKRYPARDATRAADPATDAMSNPLRFLKTGPVFTSTIRVENVHPVELGAVVWAVTFGQHGGPDQGYRHMLGRAKGYGFGQTRAEIAEHKLRDVLDGTYVDPAGAMAAFVGWVTKGIAGRRPDDPPRPFDQLEPIRRLLNTAHARTGRQLQDSLRFPEAQADTPAERILKGYQAIRDETFRGGKAGLHAGEPGFLSLPAYPRYDPSEEV